MKWIRSPFLCTKGVWDWLHSQGCTMQLKGPAAWGLSTDSCFVCTNCKPLLLPLSQSSWRTPARKWAILKFLLLLVGDFHEVPSFPCNSFTFKCAENEFELDSEPYGQAEGQHMAVDCSVLIYSIFKLSFHRRQWYGQSSVFWIGPSCMWESETHDMASVLKLVSAFLVVMWVQCRGIFTGNELLGVEIQSVHLNYGLSNRNVTLSRRNYVSPANIHCRSVPRKQGTSCSSVNPTRWQMKRRVLWSKHGS